MQKMILHLAYLSLICIARTVESLRKPEIYSLHIYSDIKYRYATTKVTSRMKNADYQSQEALFDISLPNEAFITNLTLDIDGEIVVGEIKEKEVARQQYVAAQRRGESAGYIETKQRETNRFNLAITVAAQKKVSFNLTYQELLKRRHGLYEQVIYIDPGAPVHDIDVTVSIVESRTLTKLRVPPLRNDVNPNLRDLSTITVINQLTPTTALIRFTPSVDYQIEQAPTGIAGQFVVQYDVARDLDTGDILLVNGYFVHFFAPEGYRPIANDVLFVLDTSGSMYGTKLSQLKEAMTTILTQMLEGDRMNIMTFSNSISLWRMGMISIANEDARNAAMIHIKALQAAGGTDIEHALTSAITCLQHRTSENGAVRTPIIVFFTDGEPTSGVTDRRQILKNVQIANTQNIPIFSLAFGSGADYELVRKIAIENNGIGRKIYEASDASLQMRGFYNEIAITLLNNLTFQYLDALVVNVTKHSYMNYFNGSEIVISGHVKSGTEFENNKLTLQFSSTSADGPKTVLLSSNFNTNILGSFENLTHAGSYEMITEKLWAYLTIKQLLDKELVADDANKKEYSKQILELSLKYGFVTPLTSMVVTKSSNNTNKCLGSSDEQKYMSYYSIAQLTNCGVYISSAILTLLLSILSQITLH